MSLVTIERSSSSDNLSQISGERTDSEEDQIDGDVPEDVFVRPRATSSVEGFFASKGAAYAIPDGDFARKASLKGGELQSHLQGMVNLIRDEDTMRLVVKVESEAKYIRYLCIVTTCGLSDDEESVVLGFDWIEDKVTLGLVIPLWSNVSTKLDGDGGFEIKTEHLDYIFKPVSVQTLWTALSWIHKCLQTAHRAKHFAGGLSHAWLDYYQNKILSPEECINFWKSMKGLEKRRDICFSYFDKVKTDEELLKGSIRNKLKEILTRFDLEEVTCRQVREALEAEMKMSLQHLKGYVEEQLFVILGQMESSSKITDHLYLGSEWNACNLQELKDNGVGYILNITKEVDNFFPGTFEYMNIRIYDIKEADLLRHWGKTYRFIHKAKERGFATLVHCRRGISRSASTVVAYLMKENNMSLSDSMKFVKSKRSIVQPNSGFWKQLIIYEGILKSSRNRHNSLFRRRSNSDTTKVSRPHKKGRHHTDHVDNTPERAHTLPRISNEFCLESEGENLGEGDTMSPPEEPNESGDEESPDLASSEDISSNSDEEPSKTKLNIRRTVSEPAMMRFTSSILKPRAQTFSDQQASDVVRSPTSISEDAENQESDVIWIDAVKELEHSSEEVLEVSNQESETKDSSTGECLTQNTSEVEISLEDKQNVSEENIENILSNGTWDTQAKDTIDTEKLTNTGEVGMTELSSDDKEVPCEESLRVDSPLEKSPHVDSPLEESPREDSSDFETSPPAHRQRSRSIGEKLVGKLLLKQGRSDSSDNLKKVNVRGRVRRRERKAKSDLQISGSGFVKRHTQIIEEQMLYSLLMNSEKTLATLAVDFWDNSNPVQGNSGETQQNSMNNRETDLEKDTTVTSVTDSENNSVNMLEKDVNLLEKNSKELCEKDCVKSSEGESSCDKNNLDISEKDNSQYSQKQLEDNCEQTSVQTLDENSQTSSENCSGERRTTRLASQELQEIVQKVNAEAKQDIQTQGDILRAPVISQKELRHSSESEDLCIDEMTWIDLTHHRGDVVKRRSAAFQNVNAKTESCSRKQGSKMSELQTVVLPQPNACQGWEQAQVPYGDNTTNSKTSSLVANTSVPRLDLDELKKDEYTLPRSNSIIVEDYNSWESSSVRDRTKILESIIAKTGGSFPSPRSRVSQSKPNDSEVESELHQDMNELNIDTNQKTDECSGDTRESSSPIGTTSEQPAEGDVFGDEPVKNLVDKFEGKNEGSE